MKKEGDAPCDSSQNIHASRRSSTKERVIPNWIYEGLPRYRLSMAGQWVVFRWSDIDRERNATTSHSSPVWGSRQFDLPYRTAADHRWQTCLEVVKEMYWRRFGALWRTSSRGAAGQIVSPKFRIASARSGLEAVTVTRNSNCHPPCLYRFMRLLVLSFKLLREPYRVPPLSVWAG